MQLCYIKHELKECEKKKGYLVVVMLHERVQWGHRAQTLM